MNDYNIFDHQDGNEETPKNKFEGLSNDEVIEILEQELLEKEEEEKREEERKKQAFIKAKKDKKYKEYSAKVELLYMWMIGFTLFAVVSAGYWYYKDYFFISDQGYLWITGTTKELGKAIVEFILSIMLCFLSPALLVCFIVDLKQDDEEK